MQAKRDAMVLMAQPTKRILPCIHPQRSLVYFLPCLQSVLGSHSATMTSCFVYSKVLHSKMWFRRYARRHACLVQCRRCKHARSVVVCTCVRLVTLDVCCAQGWLPIDSPSAPVVTDGPHATPHARAIARTGGYRVLPRVQLQSFLVFMCN